MKIPFTTAKKPTTPGLRARRGFSLVEVMVAMAILGVLMLIITQILGQMQRTWSSAASKLSHFREARRVFDVVKRNLSQSTLNTYLRYRYAAGGGGNPFTPFDPSGAESSSSTPMNYVRFSELQFICGPVGQVLTTASGASNPGHAMFFYAPLGFSSGLGYMPSSLNGRGYYVEYGSDETYRPPFVQGRVPERFRYRLMEYLVPTENVNVYDNTMPFSAYLAKFSRWAEGDHKAWSRPVADNIVAMFVAPKMPTAALGGGGADPYSQVAPAYFYNSADPAFLAATVQPNYSHQLPPAVELVMVVVDEQTSVRLAQAQGQTAPLDISSLNLFSQNASEASFQQDMKKLKDFMNGKNINFRIFTSTVSLRNSRWNG